MKKKVLVMYARYGSGHKSIAEYVSTYLESHNKNIEVKLLDITDYGNALGKIGIKVWDWIGKRRHEKLFDIGYEIMDHKVSTLSHNYTTKFSYDNDKIRKIITDYNPNITISTHFYCSGLITRYNKLGLINSKLFTIITDYRTHEIWTHNYKSEDGFIVGNDLVKEELIKRGIPSKKIYSFGLPLNINELNNLDDKNTIYNRYNIDSDNPVYLFFGGSSIGSMYYYDYFKAITKLNLDAYIIFICGKNEKLKKKCDKYIKKKNINDVLVLGYSNDVLNLMKISSLVISKPGGATVTECLEMKVPMLLVPGLGGQEKYNARFISKKKYGLNVSNIRKFKKALLKIEENPNIINKMQERLNKLSNNDSVVKINNLINKL